MTDPTKVRTRGPATFKNPYAVAVLIVVASIFVPLAVTLIRLALLIGS